MISSSKLRLGDLFGNRRQRGKPGLPLMSVTMYNGLVERDSIERKMESTLSPEEHLLIKKGDIAYNMMRMWQGASGLAKHDGIVSPAYVVVAPKKGIDPLFASYWLKSPRMIYLLWAYSYGITKDRLRLYYNDFAQIPVTIPPFEVQVKIGEALSTWDRAIEQTQAVIAAKTKLKKALMQQLLTGKRRFKEFRKPAKDGAFPSDWTKTSLGKIADVRFSSVDKKAYTGQSKALLCNYMDVYNNDYITRDFVFMEATASQAEISSFGLLKGDVLEPLAKRFHYHARHPFPIRRRSFFAGGISAPPLTKGNQVISSKALAPPQRSIV